MAHQTEYAALQTAVQDAISQARVGTPAFLRCIARTGGATALDAVLQDLVSMADAWFASSAVRRHRLGEETGVYLTEVLKWPEGQSALLSVTSATPETSTGIDLMLVGSRGTLYHET